MDIKDIFKLKEDVSILKQQLIEKEKDHNQKLYEYIKNYFNGNNPAILPLSKNQFINVRGYKAGFSIEKSETGNFYWKATGTVINIKDGKEIHGHSTKEMYQGEYEALPLEIKNLTLEDAKKLSLPMFPIISRNFNGTDYSAIGYELAKNEKANIILVWRKSGSAYIDRMTKSIGSESELQILRVNKNNHDNNNTELKSILSTMEKKIGADKFDEIFRGMVSGSNRATISIGGRLKKEVILKNAEIISTFFGDEAVNEIVGKIELNSKRKTVVKNESSTIEKKKKM